MTEPYDLHVGDCRAILATLPERSVQCVVTSPPYFGLRDYGASGQIGLEPTPDAYVAELVEVFRGVRRVLRDDGTVWLNLGDSYAGAGYSNHDNTGGAQREDGGKQKHLTGSGLKNKDLIGIPWRVAFALQADGWYLRSDIIWHKPNPMPESVTDRPTKSHEYIFLLTKSARYYYDLEAIREPVSENWQYAAGAPMPELGDHRTAEGARGHQAKRVYDTPKGANKRTVWSVNTAPYPEAHFATYPPELIRPCILAGSREGDTILDPFNGAGTTGLVALQHHRHYIGIELNPEYAALTRDRLAATAAQPTLFASAP